MSQPVHPDYIKASNLILITLVLSVISSFFTPNIGIVTPLMKIGVVILSIIINGLIAYFIRRGSETVKYILLILLLFGLASIPMMISLFKTRPVSSIISLVLMAIQVWVIVILFKIPKHNISYKPERGPDAV
ncbi:hypothetical protein HQ865_01865 [Mucilaginibacter mali]|uniref:Uncharacterized protein n=1 Tax=Mucilaginibacter mali TaxID=2740462 RepID=A0A7D4TLU1_9SPHI|nr:hypothetical protein [Mucilaginibacter mali]QKJ28554.1 hypothetical protein HQ865_01865 [Mucilaginibacter mali]